MIIISSIMGQFNKVRENIHKLIHNHEDFNKYKTSTLETSRRLHKLYENNIKLNNDSNTFKNLNSLINALDKKDPEVSDLKLIENSDNIISDINKYLEHRSFINHNSLRLCAGRILEEKYGVISKESQSCAADFLKDKEIDNLGWLILETMHYKNDFLEIDKSLTKMRNGIKKIAQKECPTKDELNAMCCAPNIAYIDIYIAKNPEWETKNQSLSNAANDLWNVDIINKIEKLAKGLLERLPEKAFKLQEPNADHDTSQDILANG